LCFREENYVSIRLVISLSDTVSMKVGPVIILVLFTFNVSRSQARHGKSGSSAQSSLTVTATVEPSVWLVMEPDGKRDVVVANAPDPKESFSHRFPKPHKTSASPTKKQNSSVAKSQEPLQKQDDTEVHFDFPTASRQFDVTQKTVMVNVSEGAKTVARPVTVTTVVAQ
jgi:hypothetical protein